MSAFNTRLGKCEVCNNPDSKYTCPRCEAKTCSLPCVNIHKKELNCSGIRNKIAYKPLLKFTNFDLQSDYRLLEEMTRSVENYAKDSSKQYTRCNRELPVHLFKLRAAATKRGTKLLFLPKNFSRHQDNSTFLNWKTQVITWAVEWIFPQADNIKCSDERLCEGDRLGVLVSRYLNPEQCPQLLRDRLQFYHSAGLGGVLLLLKAEHVRRAGSRFHRLDPTVSLKENLTRKTIIEFPTVYVVFSTHKDVYDILDSDEEEEENEEVSTPYHSGSASRRQNRNRKQKMKGGQNVNQSKNLLFHNSECSDDSSDSDSGKRSKLGKSVGNGTVRGCTSFPSFAPYATEGASTSDNFSTNIGFDIPPYNVLIRQQY